MEWAGDVWNSFWDVIKAPPWGEAALAAGIITAIPALVGFGFWAAEQRRRPEIEFLWKLSTTGEVNDLAAWPPDHKPNVLAGSRLLVEASVKNVGDAATKQAMTNFGAPMAVELTKVTGTEPRPTPIQVGGHATQFVPATFDLGPGVWQLQRFQVVVPDEPLGVRLRMTISDDGLNASGRRWLPSRLAGLDDADTTAYEDRWPPPRPAVRRQWKRIRAEPHGRVWCVRGERADVRDLRVTVNATTEERQDVPGR